MKKRTRTGKRKSHLHGFLDQSITPWNGALYSRAHLLSLLRHSNWSQEAIDYWVFRPEALSEQAITQMYACGHLINMIPNVFPGWYCEEE